MYALHFRINPSLYFCIFDAEFGCYLDNASQQHFRHYRIAGLGVGCVRLVYHGHHLAMRRKMFFDGGAPIFKDSEVNIQRTKYAMNLLVKKQTKQ